MTARLAVLASGRGSNLQAILHAIEAGTLKADVVGVFSDRPAAAALRQVPPEKRWSARPAAFSARAAVTRLSGDSSGRASCAKAGAAAAVASKADAAVSDATLFM